jgi:2-polyprenyl-6-methoxyphenol hydroxylase-like FAD-dependent oxidoreductase
VLTTYNTNPVVIAGGGVAGLATANALASRGIRSIVLEKTSAPGTIDRGDIVHQASLALFERWGVGAVLHNYNYIEFSKFQILNNFGKCLFSIDISHDERIDAVFTSIKHPDIERLLEESAMRTGMVTVIRDTPVSDLIFEGTRVRGVKTSAGDFAGSLVVIANGARSRIRDNYFLQQVRHEYPVSFYNALFKQKNGSQKGGTYVLGSRGVMVIVPLPGDEIRIGIQQRADRSDNKITRGNVKNIIAELLTTLNVEELELVESHHYPLTMSLSNPLWIPGAVLVGDAAHTTHPVGGQGMNLAFQDAEALANALSASSAESTRLDRACSRYSSERISKVRKILRSTHILGNMGIYEHYMWVRFREVLLTTFNKSSFVKRLVLYRIVNSS